MPQSREASSIEAGCRDVAQDGRGYIIALDDDDLLDLVNLPQAVHSNDGNSVLHRKFRSLVM